MRNGQPFSYSSWDALIKSSFEKYFYVPLENESTAGYALNPALINRRGIYKDTLGSSTEWYTQNSVPVNELADVICFHVIGQTTSLGQIFVLLWQWCAFSLQT